jgi:carboxypeptidase Taq
VQFYEQAKVEIPHLEDEIAAGQLMVLRRWLAHKIHRWGRMFPPEHLSQRVTGVSLSPEPFLRYIDRKYGDLYHL